jgi:hypothetical protein
MSSREAQVFMVGDLMGCVWRSGRQNRPPVSCLGLGALRGSTEGGIAVTLTLPICSQTERVASNQKYKPRSINLALALPDEALTQI